MANEGIIDLLSDRAMLRRLYAPPAETFSMVDVPKLPFAVWTGDGVPEQQSVSAVIKDLYTAIYPIRRKARERMGKSFVEPPVELLYWADDMRDLSAGHRKNWRWRVQISLPVWINAEGLEESAAEMRQELKDAASQALHWEAFAEGKCVQALYVGQTSGLPVMLDKLYREYLPEQGLEPSGPYHEIYLDDWSRVAPAKRKMILRQPVRALPK
ncbi:GyrI-like domain-containing protein [Chromobacterium sp. Beijing]|uniref:GyrI-like domain-containing protein n=1 Tax=Chromobacterium sp. Beijing TaxID=2735795 RepID=UPI001F320E00|nr:GyrI-like domain-containing protein [Chromobacterium sp. Beijing]UJB31087.1 hypothetical protein HQN78_08460 [Chromobacterium sp. Beijing]